MKRHALTTLLALCCSIAMLPASPAHACSPPEPNVMEVDAEAHANDDVPPSAVDVVDATARFYEGDDECLADHWSVELVVDATDDVTPTDLLGFLVVQNPDATVPTKLEPGRLVDKAEAGRIHLRFDAAREGTVTVVVHAVDEGGNVGPGAEAAIVLEDDEAGGCSISAAPRTASPCWLLAMLAGLAVARRRRRHP